MAVIWMGEGIFDCMLWSKVYLKGLSQLCSKSKWIELSQNNGKTWARPISRTAIFRNLTKKNNSTRTVERIVCTRVHVSGDRLATFFKIINLVMLSLNACMNTTGSCRYTRLNALRCGLHETFLLANISFNFTHKVGHSPRNTISLRPTSNQWPSK